MNRRMNGAGHHFTVPALVMGLIELSGLRDENRSPSKPLALLNNINLENRFINS